MNVHTQISDYLAAQPERKRGDLQTLHAMMLRLMPDGRLAEHRPAAGAHVGADAMHVALRSILVHLAGPQGRARAMASFTSGSRSMTVAAASAVSVSPNSFCVTESCSSRARRLRSSMNEIGVTPRSPE